MEKGRTDLSKRIKGEREGEGKGKTGSTRLFNAWNRAID